MRPSSSPRRSPKPAATGEQQSPPVPRISTTLLSEHRDRASAARRRAGRRPTGRGPAWSPASQLRTTIAAVANVRPSIRGGSGPRVLPRHGPSFRPPTASASRAWPPPTGTSTAGWRSSSSVTTSRPVFAPRRPYVLNALTEGRMDNPDESNPGMIRAVEFDGNLPVAPYPAPPRSRCRALLESAVAVAGLGRRARRRSAPPGCSTSSERSIPSQTVTAEWLACFTSC